jgi:hypothetical protein
MAKKIGSTIGQVFEFITLTIAANQVNTVPAVVDLAGTTVVGLVSEGGPPATTTVNVAFFTGLDAGITPAYVLSDAAGAPYQLSIGFSAAAKVWRWLDPDIFRSVQHLQLKLASPVTVDTKITLIVKSVA